MRRPVALGFAVLVSFALVAVAREKKPDRAELENLMTETDAIAQKVSAIRGLPIKKPIARGIMSKDEVTRRVLQRIDDEYAAEDLLQEERAAKRLGFLAPDADYKDIVIKLLTEQIAGFYDPTVKELYIADWVGADTQRIVVAHEIDHALQDQNFDLVNFTRPVKDNADMQLARQALVEGDGVALMIEFMFAEMGVKYDPWATDAMVDQLANASAQMVGFDEFKRAPLFLRESLIFPYVGGLKLIAATRRHHSWSRVDEMFAKPPVSTEQVLHPEKYFANEKPVTVKSTALPSLKKYKVVYENVFGELMFSVLFRQHGVSDKRARLASEGWGGDRYVILAPPGDDGRSLDGLVVACMSAWDAEADAIEAYDALVEALLGLSGAGKPREEKKGEYAAWDDRGGTVAFVERKGTRVAFMLGAPADKAAKLRGELWKWK